MIYELSLYYDTDITKLSHSETNITMIKLSLTFSGIQTTTFLFHWYEKYNNQGENRTHLNNLIHDF